jgi:smad nuclear-interacting protein 1
MPSNMSVCIPEDAENLDLIHIYKQSAYLVGRDTVVSEIYIMVRDVRTDDEVTDIPVAHPSCSKQHAAIQFRQITEKNEYGETSSSVK